MTLLLKTHELEKLGAYFEAPYVVESLSTDQELLRHNLGGAALRQIQLRDAGEAYDTEGLAALKQRNTIWGRLAAAQTAPHGFYVPEESGIKTRPNQTQAFFDTVHIGGLLDEPQIPPTTITDMLTVSRQVIQPTGYGKTVAGAITLHNFGVGETEQGDEKPRALVVAPSIDTLEQWLKNPKTGLDRFFPHMSRQILDSSTRNAEEVDVLGMTYNLFSRYKLDELVKLLSNRVIQLYDEAHHLLGAKSMDAFKQLERGKINVALTATPRYDDSKELQSLIPKYAVNISLLEGLRTRVLREARLFMVASGAKFDAEITNDAYSLESMHALGHHVPRNELIVNLAVEQVENGMQGHIPCVRGKDSEGNGCAHAYRLADMLGERMVPITDEDGAIKGMRAVVAKVITGQEPNADEYKAAYDRGEVDVLLYVDKLREGYDSNRVGFIIYARPTTSALMLEQQFGRGTRKGYYGYCNHIYIADNIAIGKTNPFTPFHLLKLRKIEQGITIGGESESSRKVVKRTTENSEDLEPSKLAPEPRDRRNPSYPNGRTKLDTEPLLRKLSNSLHGMLLETAFVGEDIEILPNPPKNWIEFTVDDHSIDSDSVLNYLLYNSIGEKPKWSRPVYVHAADVFTLYIPPEANAFLEKLSAFESPKTGEISIQQAANEWGESPVYLQFYLATHISPRRTGAQIQGYIPRTVKAQLPEAKEKYRDMLSLDSVLTAVNDTVHTSKDGSLRDGDDTYRSSHIVYCMNKLGLPTFRPTAEGNLDVAYTGRRHLTDWVRYDHAKLIIEAFCGTPRPKNSVLLKDVLREIGLPGIKQEDFVVKVNELGYVGKIRQFVVGDGSKELCILWDDLVKILRTISLEDPNKHTRVFFTITSETYVRLESQTDDTRASIAQSHPKPSPPPKPTPPAYRRPQTSPKHPPVRPTTLNPQPIGADSPQPARAPQPKTPDNLKSVEVSRPADAEEPSDEFYITDAWLERIITNRRTRSFALETSSGLTLGDILNLLTTLGVNTSDAAVGNRFKICIDDHYRHNARSYNVSSKEDGTVLYPPAVVQKFIATERLLIKARKT